MPTEEVILNSHGDRGVQCVQKPNVQQEYAEYQLAENLRTRILNGARTVLAYGGRPTHVELTEQELALLRKHGRALELMETDEGIFFVGLPVVAR